MSSGCSDAADLSLKPQEMQPRSPVAAVVQRFEAGIGKQGLVKALTLFRLDYDQRVRHQSADLAKPGRHRQPVTTVIGGIGKNEPGGMTAPAGQFQRITGDDSGVVLAAKPCNVCPQGLQRTGVTLHEAGMGRPARKRFEPQRAGTGKSVDDMRLKNSLAKAAACQNVEQGLADTVGGRTCVSACRFGQFCSAMATGDYPHVVKPPKMVFLMRFARWMNYARLVPVRMISDQASIPIWRPALAPTCGKACARWLYLWVSPVRQDQAGRREFAA